MNTDNYYQITFTDFELLKKSSVGERIRFIRKKLMEYVNDGQFTSTSICERTGIAAQTISSIERGESKKPSFGVISTLAREFNVPMEVFTDEFYCGDDGNLFVIGKVMEPIDLTEIDLDEVESIKVANKEYFVGDIIEGEPWDYRRKISIKVFDETNENQIVELYDVAKSYKELELIRMIGRLIQEIELDPYDLSVNEFQDSLQRSPLREAKEIVTKSNVKPRIIKE